MKRHSFLEFVVILECLIGACSYDESAHKVAFEAQSVEFADAVDEYRAIWAEDGVRIVDAMERATGLRVEPGPIRAIVYEGVSRSGYRDIPMNMRASYSLETKRATLVHEMSHRLISDLVPTDFDDHPIVFLFLYDVWVDLWGKSFADSQVAVESARRGIYNYEAAWNLALELGPDQRAARWNEFLLERRRPNF